MSTPPNPADRPDPASGGAPDPYPLADAPPPSSPPSPRSPEAHAPVHPPRVPPLDASKPYVIPVFRVPEPYALSDDPRFQRPGERVPRPRHRQYLALLLIGSATAMALGHTLRTASQFEANDISRWCTVWSLVERRSYAIDDCPWQSKTQDKVKKPDKVAPPGPDAGPIKKFEYAIAPERWKTGEPVKRFYSSKPPLLPTLIAALIYPFRAASGVELDRVVDQTRLPRNVEKPVPGQPGKTEFTVETPEAAHWPAHVFYFKPVIVLLNVVPMLVLLVLYARLLDRVADDDWAWFLSLFAASFGIYLFTFNQTLNNHTVAAWSAFFALYGLQKVWAGESRSAATFAAIGFFAAFTACNELPAAVFGALLFLMLFARFPGKTLRWFVPAAVVPTVAFLATQYIAFGQFKPVYEEFGTETYNYEGSYWNTPLEMDWFNLKENQEPYETYLFHMTIGHHGVFSLSPIFLFGLYGALREMFKRGRMAPLAWLTVLLTIAMLAFYTWNPKARNYGGSTQGLRWLFWLIPFWLALLPCGVRGGDESRWVRGISLSALVVSVFSVGYALRNPWSHPWLLDLLEHLGVYTLMR